MAFTCAGLFVTFTAGIASWIQELRMPAFTLSTPQLVGVPLAAAKDRLATQRLELEVAGERPSEQYAKGIIIKQASDGGTFAMSRVLRVTFSSGLVAPDLVGLTLPEAQATATRLGWTLVPSGPTPTKDDVRVLLQYPAPGTSVDGLGDLSVAFDP
jgi:beta-lactam-binding protein with PASTA domain